MHESYHQQRQADSGSGAEIRTCQLALAVVVVVRWFKDLDVIFITFGILLYFL
jgi:hypothetical protein